MIEPFKIALQEYGVKSISGIIHNPDVIKYYKEIGHSWVKDDETAWCAAFLNWCLKKAGRPHTGSLAARSFLTYGLSTKTPEVGDLVVLWRINPVGPYGHAGFYVRRTKDHVYILGGNQASQVNIQAFPLTQVLDYRQIPLAGTTTC